MKNNDKDIMNMFVKARSMKMDPDKKRQIKMSIISDAPVPSMFSWWMVMKVSSVTLVALLVVVAGVTWNGNVATAPIALEPTVNTESSGLPVNTVSDGADTVASFGVGGGLEEAGFAKSAAPGLFAARALPDLRGVTQKDGVEYSVRGLLDGFDKAQDATVFIAVRNIEQTEKTLNFTSGCQSYYGIDGFDSRNDQFCIQALIDINLAPGEEFMWEVVLPFGQMDLSTGTHSVAVGIEGYYEFSQPIVLE